MNLYDQIDEWTGHSKYGMAMSRPEISLDEALELHQEAVEKRKASELEERVAREVYDAKASAAIDAKRRENAAANVLIEASAEGSAAAAIGVPERVAAFVQKRKERLPVLGADGSAIAYIDQ